MSNSVNKVILVGNLGDSPKSHTFDNNNRLVRFPLATSESFYNKETQEKVSHTEWHNIVAKNKLGDLCEKYLSKGDKVYIEGKIKSRKWEDNQNQTRYITEIIAEKITFLILTKPHSEDDHNSHLSEDEEISF